MAVDQMIQKVQDALEVGKLKSKLPRNPKVVDIRVEDYVDSDGEDVLRVTIVIDEDVHVEKLSGQEITDLKKAVRRRIRELGVKLLALDIQIAKPSEARRGRRRGISRAQGSFGTSRPAGAPCQEAEAGQPTSCDLGGLLRPFPYASRRGLPNPGSGHSIIRHRTVRSSDGPSPTL